jgi:hypothetical protein
MTNFTAEQLLEGLSPELALLFFATFARFEYALKRCSYLSKHEVGRPAEASRQALATKLGKDFFSEVQATGRAKTLIEIPPKNLLVAEHDGIAFEEGRIPPTNTIELLDQVWRVRNNLFHGNKRYPGDREYDEKLMSEVLWLIQFILQKKTELSEAFHEGLYSF